MKGFWWHLHVGSFILFHFPAINTAHSSSRNQRNERKDLTVKPFVNQDFSAPPNPFPIYGESKRKLYVPRFYGINKFGNPKESKLNEPQLINIEFKTRFNTKIT